MQQAVEGASFAGVLLDAAERFLRVELHLVGGRVLRGPITAVGADFCALLTHAVAAHYVATGAVAQIRVEARSLAATGDRDNAYERTMEQVVRELAATRSRVGVVVAGSNDVLSGELRSCGLDVCTLVFDLGVATRRPSRDGSGRPLSDPECQVAHIRLSAIDELMAYEF